MFACLMCAASKKKTWVQVIIGINAWISSSSSSLTLYDY